MGQQSSSFSLSLTPLWIWILDRGGEVSKDRIFWASFLWLSRRFLLFCRASVLHNYIHVLVE